MPTLAAAPIDFETDCEISGRGARIEALPEKARIVWAILSDLHPFAFDTAGNLRDFVI